MENLILEEVSKGKIKSWISQQVREEKEVYFGGEVAVSLPERPTSLHMRSFDLSLQVTAFGSCFGVLKPLPCAPEGEAHPLSPLQARALGALMLTAHLQPILQGAAERSEREPGALFQDLKIQVNTLRMNTNRNEEKGSGAFGGRWKCGGGISLLGSGPSDFFRPLEAPEGPPFPEDSVSFPVDTCDASVAPLEAPMQSSSLRSSRPGCSTGIAGRAGDRLGAPGTLSPLFGGTLPTLITLPAVPHMPLRFSLGLLLVELRSGGFISWGQKNICLK